MLTIHKEVNNNLNVVMENTRSKKDMPTIQIESNITKTEKERTK